MAQSLFAYDLVVGSFARPRSLLLLLRILAALVASVGVTHGADQLGSPGDQAVEEVERARQSGDLLGARRLAQSWLESEPEDVVMLQSLGRIDSLLGDQHRKSNPLAASIAYRNAANAYERAQKQVERGMLPKTTYHAWAYCLYQIDQYPAAIELLQFSFERSRRDGARYALRARCHQALGQWDRAAADFTSALEHAPDDIVLLLERAEARRNQGNGGQAAKELRAAADRLPGPHGDSHTRLLRWIFEFYLGKNDVDRAIVPLEQIREHQPNLGWMRLELGILYYRKGLFDRAVAEFQPLVEGALKVKSYGLGRVYSRLGLIAQHEGNTAQAERHFRRALELSPNEATALRGIVSCLRRAGKKEEARAMAEGLRRAVRLEEEIRRLTRQISRNSRNREARSKKIGVLLDLARWEEAADEIAMYGRFIPDGSVKRFEAELVRRRRKAGSTP